MATQPTKLPEWADGSALVVEPSTGKKLVGFGAAEKVSGALTNWLFLTIYQWIAWIAAVFTNGGGAVGNADLGYPTESPTKPVTVASTVFTASSSTQNCTATAHGLLPGTGPIRITTTLTVPGGLAVATDYWAIVDDVNTFRFASSLANALTMTNINLTSAGTGTLTFVAGASPTAPAPLTLANFRDWEQHIRSKIDRLGYPSGSYSDWQEHWRSTSTTPPDGWAFTTVTGGTIGQNDPTATMPERYLQVQAGATANSSVTATPNNTGWLSNDSAIAMDWEMNTTNASPGIPGTGGGFGLQFGTTQSILFATISTGSVNSWTFTYTGPANSFGSTIPVTYGTNVRHRYRIEVLGSNNTSQATGTYQFRMYADGVLLVLINDAMTAETFRPFIKSVTSSGGGSPDAVQVGRLRLQFNHVLSGDVV